MGDQLVSRAERDEREEKPTSSKEADTMMAPPLEQHGAVVAGALTFEEILHQILNKGLGAVKATGGSLMLIDSRGEWLEIKARLGPPHPEREEGRKFRVGDGSIAGWVAQTGQAYLCPNVENDPHFAPPRSGKLHFKSLLAVPIISGNTVVGVINADSEEQGFFNEDDKRKLSRLASQVSIPITERTRLLQVLDSLHEVGVSLVRLSAAGRLSDVLAKIAKQAVKVLQIDLVTLYQYDHNAKEFLVEGTGPTIAGDLLVPGPMKTKIYKDDVPWKIVQEGESRFFPDAEYDDFVIGVVRHPGEPERPRFVVREKIKSSAALVLKVGDEIVGVMFANYRTPHESTEDEKRILATFANYAAIAIQNARLYEKISLEQDRRLAAERLAILSQVAANFAHRMNNVAGTIPVAVQELKRRIDTDDESLMRYLSRIEDDGRRLMEMAERLRRPLEAGQPEWTNVNELLFNALKQAAIPEDVEIIQDYSEDLPTITVTKSQLLEVFVNLITNAIEAMMPGGGELAIRSRITKDKKWVVVEISDTGHGMTEEVQRRVFDLFFTTKERRMGLGLWWCKTILQGLGGDISVKSKVGEGSTFTVRLPMNSLRPKSTG